MSETMSKEDQWLATEYALGVLSGELRSKAIERCESDDEFRELVEGWQNHFSPLLAEIEPARPSNFVWQAIENTLFGRENKRQSTEENKKQKEKNAEGWLASLGFWRGLTALSGTLAVASLAALMFLPGHGLLNQTNEPMPLLTTLNPNGQSPTLVLRYDQSNHDLMLQPAVNQVGEGQSPELWLIPEDGQPRSLGVISANEAATINLAEEYRALLSDQTVLAISIEPEGGSPEAGPTGEVVATGPFQNLWSSTPTQE